MTKVLRPLLACLLLSSCSLVNPTRPPTVPVEETRHRAALALLTVFNHTDQKLTIAFRSATPPTQEVVLGGVAPGARDRMAPIPAGEPIILFARRADGSQLELAARSYPIDADWTWEIPSAAVFRQP